MAQRNTTIAVSEDERELLNEVAREEWSDSQVPYGTTITMLANEYLEDD